jgi:CheY-like chemotaxis protein
LEIASTSILSALKNLATSRPKHGPSGPSRILIVDDEEPVRKFVDRVLTEAGYETTLACDGPDALQVASNPGTFDVLLTDVMMPQMTGDELARRLRQTEPRLKVLYLTGFSDHLFKEKATLWEDEAFLDKPCSVKGLRQAVSLLLTGGFEQAEPAL